MGEGYDGVQGNFEELDPREQKRLMREQAALQAGTQYAEPPPETAEYIREFSEDRSFKYDEETGELKEGNIPQEAKEDFWGVNNPNFVFANTNQDWERKKIECKMLNIRLTASMYEIPTNLKPGSKEWKMSHRLRERMLNNVNQEVHEIMKLNRTKGGRERELMVTRTIVAGSPEVSRQKGFLDKMYGYLGQGGK